jgi:polyisoprenoid-binding protein YceI
MLIIVLFTVNLFAGDTFTANAEKSKIDWHGAKVTGEHNGTINLKSGQLMVENGMLIGGSFEIDMNSIVNLDLEDKEWNAKLVNHLKSDDFFSSATYPVAKFEISEVSELKKSDSDHNIMVKGNLTIKNKTNSIEFPASFKLEGENAMASAKIVVDRSKFDVRYGSGSFFDNLGDKLIYDDFDLKINLVAEK